VVSFYDAQAAFIAHVLGRVKKRGLRTVTVRPDAHSRYNKRIQAQLARTVWANTSSYFKAGTGKVVSQWPFSASRYIWWTKLARYTSVDYT
jgi:cyclohexanone monooxygenase